MTTVGVRRTRLIIFGAGFAAAATALPACGEDNSAADTRPQIAITLGRYTIDPADLTVSPGEHSFRVTNADTMPHNLVVAGRGTRNLAPGETQLITINVDAGAYRMWCDVSGHAGMGQTGTLRAAVAVTVTTSAPLPGSP